MSDIMLKITESHLAAEGLKFGGHTAGQPIGQGRFATIWTMVDQQSQKTGGAAAAASQCEWPLAQQSPVVCKIFRAVGHGVRSFQYEAKILRHLSAMKGSDRYITRLVEAGVHLQWDPLPAVHCWFTMPMEANSLEGVLCRNLDQDGCALPVDIVRKITRSLMGALAFIHDAGVVHCDIKPGNILMQYGTDKDLKGDLAVKIADFGSAEFMTDRPEGARGTLYYAPPELLVSDAVYDTASDIWSAGATVYELLTGEMLIDVDDTETNYNLADDDSYSDDDSDGDKPTATYDIDIVGHSSQDSGDADDGDEVGSLINALTICERLFGRPPQSTRDLFKSYEIYDDAGNINGVEYPIQRVEIADLLSRRHHLTKQTSDANVRQIAEFIVACMRYRNADRITAIAACEHPWLAQ